MDMNVDLNEDVVTLRIDFYNEIARILTYPEADSFEFEPTDEEKAAIRRVLDILGRSYYASPCSEVVSTTYQQQIASLIDPSQPKAEEHDDCPCVRSEQHSNFHRCKHGYFSG